MHCGRRGTTLSRCQKIEEAQTRAAEPAERNVGPAQGDKRRRRLRWACVRAFPTTFFIDRQGEIRHVEVGYTTELGLRVRHFSAGL